MVKKIKKHKDTEKLTETEMLKVKNVLLKLQNLELLFYQANEEKNKTVREIIAAHRFDLNTTINFQEGIIEWTDHVDVNTASAPLIIASSDVEAALTNKLYELTSIEKRQMYLFLFDEPYYVWLRPKVKLLGFVRKDLWDRFQQQAKSLQPQTGAKK